MALPLTKKLDTQETIRQFFAASPEGLLLIDKKARIKMANHAIEQLMGTSQGKMIGLSFGDGLACIHTGDHADGCGYGSVCNDCFLHKAIKRGFKTKQPVQDIIGTLPMGIKGVLERPHLKVNVSPLPYQGRPHVLISIVAATAQKENKECTVSAKADLVNTLLDFLQHLVAGNTNFEARVNGNGSDLNQNEAEVLNEAMDSLLIRLQALSTIIEGIARGKLPLTETATSDKDRLGRGLMAMLGHLRRTIAQVDAGAEALGATEAQLSDTANNASQAVEDIVATFGKVTSHTFGQISAISRVNEGLEQLSRALSGSSDEIKKIIADIQGEMGAISNASEEKAKLTVGLRLTTNKMLEQVDRIVVTSQGLKGMALGLQGTMAPFILRGKEERKAALKIAYLPIADHLVMPLTYLRQLEIPNGLPLQPIRCGAWPQLIEHLENDADGALVLAPLAIHVHDDDLPVKSVMAVHRNGSGLVLKNDIEGIDDLPGRVIAVPHRYSTHNVLLYKALQQADVPYGAVEVKWAPPPLMPYFLQRGTLDGFVSAEPFPEVALDIGAGRMEFLSKDIMPNHMCCVLVMREETLDRAPREVMRLIKNFTETGKMIGQNPAKAAQDVAPFFGVAPAIMERVLTTPVDRITYDDLELHKEEFVDFGEAMVDMGLLSEVPDIDTLVDEQFYQEAMLSTV